MHLRNHILRDLGAGPSTKRDLVFHLRPHPAQDIDDALAELEQEKHVESITALETIQIYRLTEKGFQQ